MELLTALCMLMPLMKGNILWLVHIALLLATEPFGAAHNQGAGWENLREVIPGESAQILFQRSLCWEAWEEESSWREQLQLLWQLKLQRTRWRLQPLLKPGLPRRGSWAHWAFGKSPQTALSKGHVCCGRHKASLLCA